MSGAWAWVGVSTVGLALSLLVTWWLHRERSFGCALTPGGRPPANAPLIAVIVPARNEARNIRRCVEALLAQDYPNYAVYVVDDCSTDATPAILAELAAREARLTVIQASPLPPGWAGKPHALVLGVRAAGAAAGWYCFVDADTFARPGLLTAAYATAQAHGAALFSVFTRQALGTFWERTVMPLVFSALAVGFPPSKVNDPARPEAIANGQFILIERGAYAAVGGHAALRGSVTEDKDLAEAVKRSGRRLLIADGRALVETRMYTSLPELWEGWTKNIYLGLQGRLGLLLFGAGVALSGALALPGWLLAGALWAALGGGLPAALVLAEALLAALVIVAVRARVSALFEIPPSYALTLPLGALVFAAMMATSALRGLSGRGVRWKGRVYGGPAGSEPGDADRPTLPEP
ncbi:MAG: glycosyltransferase [Anaerolineales bacterium]|nr:glycosyltransferase [Anaerolineales bacterium]